MGRKPTTNLQLPRHMRARVQKSGITYYYLDLGGRPRHELPLGPDLAKALKQYAEHQINAKDTSANVVTFSYVGEIYLRDVVPTKAASTQRDNRLYLAKLYEFFNDPPALLDSIEPMHIRQYLNWRIKQALESALQRNIERSKRGIAQVDIPPTIGQTIANREVALFSAIWNQARDWGYTSLANPCQGIQKFKEEGRDIYIEDDVNEAVYESGCAPLRDSMDLAYLCGQRPSDTLSMSEADIRDNVLHIRQKKTRAKLRISIHGRLKDLLDRISARKKQIYADDPGAVHSLGLVVNEKGEGLRKDALRYRFDHARARAAEKADAHSASAVTSADRERFKRLAKDIREFQFRDLRAKAGTDKTELSGDIRKAQKQLGHASVTMTEHYVRNRKGDLVDPTK